MKRDHEIKGCLHIHSTYSDGTETIPAIARMAEQVGLNYIIMTDHMTLQPLKDGMERWFGKVAVIIGYEINDSDDTNHYLALGLNSEINKHLPAKRYVQEVKKAGGIGIIAHPDEKRDELGEHPPYPWTEWDVDDFDGIEIWNHLSEWVEGLSTFNKLYRFIHPRKSIVGPPDITLKRWDAFNLRRPVFAVGGVDAHAHVHKLFGLIPLRIFHYRVQFKTIRTHLLLDETISPEKGIEHAKAKILHAIASGHSFIENYQLGDATGFRFSMSREDQSLEMGDTIKGSGEWWVQIRVPEKSDITLLRNGKPIIQRSGDSMDVIIQAPGVFRVEVNRKGRKWIYSNPIRIYPVNGEWKNEEMA